MERKNSILPCNPNASKEVYSVLNYLNDMAGRGIITGQHTQTRDQKELYYIEQITGKLPALCGFELLSYSPNISYDSCDEECRKEILENKGTLGTAMTFAKKYRGIITFTWHWFSPLYNKNKGFYTVNSEFNASKVLVEGSIERIAFYSDMDVIANHLKPFCEAKIPILWRPFHESEGDWFWWSAKGMKVASKLYQLMYDHFVTVHKLDNLIWVWNCPKKEGYVGDAYVDIISRDLYPPAHEHTDREREYRELIQITPTKKLCALAEIGTIPSAQELSKSRIPWSYYMTWSNEFGGSDQYTSKEELYLAYHNSYAITLDKLPKLYECQTII